MMMMGRFLWESRCEDCEYVHFSAMRGVPPFLLAVPSFSELGPGLVLGLREERGGGERGGYNSIPIILVGRVLHL